ncbi:MAG: DUF3943 domain-containing protein [Elusimicrobia bacterium]|nr:DUF3943 domain-containing protein [Elusimicrobiota bacterium]
MSQTILRVRLFALFVFVGLPVLVFADQEADVAEAQKLGRRFGEDSSPSCISTLSMRSPGHRCSPRSSAPLPFGLEERLDAILRRQQQAQSDNASEHFLEHPPSIRREDGVQARSRWQSLRESAAAEFSVSAGPRSMEGFLQLRVDLGHLREAAPDLWPHLNGDGSLLVDIVIAGAIEGGAIFAGYGLSELTGIERMGHVAKGFLEFTKDNGPVGIGPIAWKDPNYGDPWVNNLGHPAVFFSFATYFKKRGYGFWESLAGATAASLMWEYVWENQEIPKSAHDLFFMNFLGSLTGAHDDLGMAWGASPINFTDSRGHYTEFYWRPKHSDRRYFFRVEPKGAWFRWRDENNLPPEERPLFVNDYSLGLADEKRGITVFATAVMNDDPVHWSDIDSAGDAFEDMRAGVSLDVTRFIRNYRSKNKLHKKGKF